MNSLLTRCYVKAIDAVHTFNRDQRGVTAIEYAVLAAAIVGLIYIVGNAMQSGMNDAANELTNAIGNATG